jgi:hypothetical protein
MNVIRNNFCVIDVCMYEDVSKSFRTESINVILPFVLLVEKQHKELWWQISLY